MRRLVVLAALTVAVVVLAAGAVAVYLGRATPGPTQPPPRERTVPVTGDTVVWVTGDSCEAGEDPDGCDDVNALIRSDNETDAVLVLGDAQYQDGTLEEYRDHYDEKMAPGLLERTWPVPGNHDYRTDDAEGYFDYWGRRVGAPGPGWYSLVLGEWRAVAANSNCEEVGGCSESSEQAEFIRHTLAEPERCELVFAHHPALSDGKHGDQDEGAALFATTYAGGGELFLAGHDHTYQRFAPKRPDGSDDPAGGVRSLVVGTGGADLHDWGDSDRSEYRQNTDLGALRLVLGRDGYTGAFVSVDGETLDEFSGGCH